MQKEDVVSKVLHNTGQFISHGSTIFKHEIRFNNGDVGIYNAKTETCTKFKEGEKVKYDIEPNGNYPAKIKPVQEEQQSFNSGGQKKYSNASQEAIIAQSVYSSTANRFQGSQMALDNKAFNEVCEERFNWVMSKIKI